MRLSFFTSFFALFLLTPTLVFAAPSFESVIGAIGESNGFSIDAPAGVSAGDLLLLHVSYEKGSGISVTNNEFTTIRTDTHTNKIGLRTAYQIYDGDNLGAVSFSEGAKWSYSISRISGVDPSTPVNTHNGANDSKGDPDPPAITTTVTETSVFALVAGRKKDITYTAPSGYTERYDRPQDNASNWGGSRTLTEATTEDPGTPTASETAEWAAATIAITPSECSDGIDNDGDGEIDHPTDDGCSSVNDDDEADPPGNGNGKENGGGAMSGGTGIRRVAFEGWAYPDAEIEMLRQRTSQSSFGIIIDPNTDISIDENGMFQAEYEGFVGGYYLFGLRATDAEGTRTGSTSFNADLRGFTQQGSRLIVDDFVFPPTIQVEDAVIPRGEPLRLHGYAAPRAHVSISVENEAVGTTTAATDGKWEFTMDSEQFVNGLKYAKARQVIPEGDHSTFSHTRAFRVSRLEQPRADLNDDNVVTVTDWSIFLSRWSSRDEDERKQVDMNGDGEVTISDLSIFLHTMQISSENLR